MEMSAQRPNTGGIVAGAILIVLGILFLAGQFIHASLWTWLWPFAIIGAGVVLLVAAPLGGRSTAGLVIPGCIITGIGLLLLYQNVSGNWESWAYAWAIIPFSAGIGIFLMGALNQNARQQRAGLRQAAVSAMLFVIFGAFFELLIFGRRGLSGIVFPALLIALGLYLLVTRSGLLPATRRPLAEPDAAPYSPAPVTPAAPPAPRPGPGGEPESFSQSNQE
jgi:hypothetical protein